MFRLLGNLISRMWVLVLALWIAAFITLRIYAPDFSEMAVGGEFNFLPEAMPSRQGEKFLARAFPDRQTTSNIVVVVSRDEKDGLTDDDRTLIEEKLVPALEQLRETINKPEKGHETNKKAIVEAIHTFREKGLGSALVSQDRKSTLVIMELATDFQDSGNWKIVEGVEQIVSDLLHNRDLPSGLHLNLTGSATLGRDLSRAEADSAKHIGPLTVGMVIVLLIVIYRAPLLAFVPLLTLFLAVDISLHLLTLLSQMGYVPIFRGLEVYTTVITYGPGIDYCLFLIARYKENLLECVKPGEALALTVGQVGAAITASAATVICGIGMLTFAQFGKFHEAGISISIALCITLMATLTLTPSLLYLTGRWTFWPKSGVQCLEQAGGDRDKIAIQQNPFQPLWTAVGEMIGRRPLLSLLITVGVLMPFAILGFEIYGSVSYGLLETLPKESASARGAAVLEKDFPAGITGPVLVLVHNDDVDFGSQDGVDLIKQMSDELMKNRNNLQISDIRSVANPVGQAPLNTESSDQSELMKVIGRRDLRQRSVEYYVSRAPELNGHVSEMDIILTMDPFSKGSVDVLDRLMPAIQASVPKDQSSKTRISFVGTTASVRDVDTISQSDQQRIVVMVVACVLVILIALLRTITVSIYLMITVLFSYIATLGVTWLIFYCLDPHGFLGLDWTVALFLFVVLIAVGEDYNIFLVTRIHEEQKRVGPKKGIVEALTRTGGVITSCGFIMAGTFSSLCFGSLARMQQLGVALALGVLLDTFVIRPILVPAYMMVINDERFGNLARYLK